MKSRKNSAGVVRQIKVNLIHSPIPSQPGKVPGGSARNNTVNVFLKPEVYQGIPAVVKRIPLSSTYPPPSILPRFRGAKYSSNLVTLPSVRWGLFIRGVSRLSFIVAALSFVPSFLPLRPLPFISFPFFLSCTFLLLLSLSLVLSLLFSPSDITACPCARTYYIPALTYSGLMPVVLPFPNLLSAASNEHRLPTAPAGSPLFSFVLVYCALDLSLSLSLARNPCFPARDASSERYRRKSWQS